MGGARMVIWDAENAEGRGRLYRTRRTRMDTDGYMGRGDTRMDTDGFIGRGGTRMDADGYMGRGEHGWMRMVI